MECFTTFTELKSPKLSLFICSFVFGERCQLFQCFLSSCFHRVIRGKIGDHLISFPQYNNSTISSTGVINFTAVARRQSLHKDISKNTKTTTKSNKQRQLLPPPTATSDTDAVTDACFEGQAYTLHVQLFTLAAEPTFEDFCPVITAKITPDHTRDLSRVPGPLWGRQLCQQQAGPASRLNIDKGI